MHLRVLASDLFCKQFLIDIQVLVLEDVEDDFDIRAVEDQLYVALTRIDIDRAVKRNRNLSKKPSNVTVV